MGMKFRDEDDEFAGAPFRDEKTKIMFAYDYTSRTNIRVRGGPRSNRSCTERCYASG